MSAVRSSGRTIFSKFAEFVPRFRMH